MGCGGWAFGVGEGRSDHLGPEHARPVEVVGIFSRAGGLHWAVNAVDALANERPLFRGLELADSVSLDPHKWLYVPIDSGCLLFRDEAKARAAFSFDDADYIRVHEQNADESFAFWNYGPELSRRFRALKIWLSVKVLGLSWYRELIARSCQLAELAQALLEQEPSFEILSPTQLSIVCFRYRGLPPLRLTEDDLDRLNLRIVDELRATGRAFISSTRLRSCSDRNGLARNIKSSEL